MPSGTSPSRRQGRWFATALGGATFAGLAVAAVPPPAGNAVAGKVSYNSKCGGCHSLDTNRIGPSHRGVVGRAPGSALGYAYSQAVRKLGGVWTPARLDLWLQNTQKVAPGSKMYFSVSDPTERRNIIAYLQSVSPAAKKR